MDKLGKMMKGLECCILHDPDDKQRCSECTYTGNCVNRLKQDALSLLKTQEPQYVYDCAEMIDDIVVGKCPSCDRTIVNKINDPTQFCKYCGQAVKWDD